MPLIHRPDDGDARRLVAAGLLVALVACAPLPPAPPAIRVPSGAPQPAPPSEPAPSAPAAPATPIPAPPPAPAAPAYSAAVAARFPDPPLRYDTPGLRNGRNHFTTQAELQDLLRSLAGPPRTPSAPTVRVLVPGSSQRGVALEALLFTRAPSSDAASLVQSARPTVLLVGQQHGDEPASAEALLVIARELASGRLAPLLERINVIVMPRANPDGAQVGQRVSANGIDVNRDHLLLRTPEALALAQLVREYRPMVVIDAHEYTVLGRYLQKFGAVQRFDALVQYAMTPQVPEFITRAAEEWFRLPMLDSLRREQLTAEWYYTTPTDVNDRKVSMGGVRPDTGRNVNGLKNAISFLIETRGVGIGHLHAQRRVHTHVTAISSVLASTASRAADLLKLRQFVEAEVSALACQGLAVVDAAPTRGEYRLLMLDPETGADRPVTVDWDSSLTLEPRKLRARPCGYWLAAEASGAVQRLRALGVQVSQVSEAARLQGDTYREVSRTSAPREDVRGTIADDGETVAVEVELISALLDVPAGSYYVPLTQPLANLVIAAMEPDTQNSYFANRVIGSVDHVARLRVLPELKTTPVH